MQGNTAGTRDVRADLGLLRKTTAADKKVSPVSPATGPQVPRCAVGSPPTHTTLCKRCHQAPACLHPKHWTRSLCPGCMGQSSTWAPVQRSLVPAPCTTRSPSSPNRPFGSAGTSVWPYASYNPPRAEPVLWGWCEMISADTSPEAAGTSIPQAAFPRQPPALQPLLPDKARCPCWPGEPPGASRVCRAPSLPLCLR